MPRPGQVKLETDERLSDRIAVGLSTWTFPPELVDRVVADFTRRPGSAADEPSTSPLGQRPQLPRGAVTERQQLSSFVTTPCADSRRSSRFTDH